MTEPLGAASPHYYHCALSTLIHLNSRGQSRPADETNDASCLARSQPARDALSPSPRAPGRRSRPIGGHLLLPREQSDSAYSHHDHKETTSRRARLSFPREMLYTFDARIISISALKILKCL